MRIYLILSLLLLMIRCSAQTQELKQLAYNTEKLAQMKLMLDKMVKGYTVLSNGYNTISNISKGNYDLHKAYLDALWIVSPAVAKDKRIEGIITKQATIVKEYKQVWQTLQSGTLFTVKELAKLKDDYENIIEAGLQSVEDLSLIITSNKLRMNDAERLSAIGQIETDMNNTVKELKAMNEMVNGLVAQRKSIQKDTKALKELYGSK